MVYSFCIITDGKEPVKTLRLIESIREQNVSQFEILIGGDVPARLELAADVAIQMPEKARMGRLGAMRNALCREAHGTILVVLDDDIILADDWAEGMEKYGEDFDLLSCVIINPDGTRYWDWKTYKDGNNALLPYDQTSPDISLTGGLCIMKRQVFNAVQWDETRGFYENEDVDFTNRVKAAGLRIAFNPYSLVVHDAPYTGNGEIVIRK
jgi:cellulose synthase/poly-beta-1,6-N-acetylglucosamine synthase-like glycosyltransferase